MNTISKALFPFESKWIDLGGNRVHYVDEGHGDTLLFCHPSIATSFMYRHLIRLLSPNYRCVALDFPGFGLSTAHTTYTYSIQSQAEVMSMFIEKLALTNLYPVVQEVGGHAAIIALLPTPQKVKGVIITDTILFPISEYKRISNMLGFINSMFFNFVNGQFNLLIRVSYRFGIRNRKLSKAERQVYKRAFDTKEKRRLITHMLNRLKVEEGLMNKIRNGFETTLNKKPALLIYGSKDPVHEMGISQRIKSMLPYSELHLIEGEAHFPHEGTPNKMARLISNWMVKLNR
jgi:haloalkane dehalogenase